MLTHKVIIGFFPFNIGMIEPATDGNGTSYYPRMTGALTLIDPILNQVVVWVASHIMEMGYC